MAAGWPTQDPDPAAKRPALRLLELLDQQFHMRQPSPVAEKVAPSPGRAAPVSRPLAHRGLPQSLEKPHLRFWNGPGGRRTSVSNRRAPVCRRRPTQYRGPSLGGYARKKSPPARLAGDGSGAGGYVFIGVHPPQPTAGADRARRVLRLDRPGRPPGPKRRRAARLANPLARPDDPALTGGRCSAGHSTQQALRYG